MLLLGFPQEVAKKGTKGPNALKKPATRKVVPLSLHSFFRESKHLQPLRLQVKKTCKHESNTQAQKQRLLPSATPPSSTKFQTKTILFSAPATKTGCRGASPYRERKYFFFLRLPRVVAKRREKHWMKDVFFLYTR
ncbi:MAG: hypothetical protein E7605_02255 [Ruminococcaceae bacterium]|nr:hypothetical protein [Oscillospiraceae bacterium]